MKIKIPTLGFALALGAALVQPNLATAQSKKPTSVVSLAEMKNQLTRLQADVSATVESLQQVKESANNSAKLSQAAAKFSSQFAALEAQIATVRTQAVVVKALSKEHFEAWQKELATVQSTTIREKAQERFTDTKEEFDKIIAKAEKAKKEALPFVSEIKDISIYLATDLSEDAVKSLSNTIWKLGNESRSVIGSIQDVNEQIDRTLKALPKK